MKSNLKAWMQYWSKFYSYLKNSRFIQPKNEHLASKLKFKDENIPKIILIRFFIVLYYIKKHQNNKIIDFKQTRNFDELLSVHTLVSKTKQLNRISFDQIHIFEPKIHRQFDFCERQLDFSNLKDHFVIFTSNDYLYHLKPEDLGFIYEQIILNQQSKSQAGIFYTPSVIASFMTKDLLLTHYLQLDTSVLVDRYNKTDSQETKGLEQKLQTLKVIDPSCGSGIFLTQFYKLLLVLYQKLIHKPITFKLKHYILTKNLFGIDKDLESVSITRIIFTLLLQNLDENHMFEGFESNLICTDTLITPRAFDTRFDLVIGNPPWGIKVVKDIITDVNKKNLQKLFKRQVDASLIFFMHNLFYYVKTGGIISYLLPNEFCFNSSYTAIRKKLLTYDIIELVNLGFNLFRGVTKPSVVLTVRNSQAKTSPLWIITNIPPNLKQQEGEGDYIIEYIERNKVSFDRNLFLSNIDAKFSFWMSQHDATIVKRHFSNLPHVLKDYLKNGRGIDTNRQGIYFVCPKCSYLNPPFGVGNASKLSQKQCGNKRGCDFSFIKNREYKKEILFSDKIYSENSPDTTVPGIIGSDLQRFHFQRPFRACHYYGDKLDQAKYEKYSLIEWKHPDLYQGEKILFRKVSTSFLPIVMYHNGFLLFNQQIYCFQLREGMEKSLLLLFFAIVSSRLFFYYQLVINKDKEKVVLSHFTQNDVLEFPINNISQALGRTGQVTQLVELTRSFVSMLNKLSFNLQDTKENTTLALLKEAGRIFDKIDQGVFSLYEINPQDRSYIREYTDRNEFHVFQTKFKT